MTPKPLARRRTRIRIVCLLGLLIAYFAGLWNGATDSWWVTGAATAMMFAATFLVVWGYSRAF